MLALCAKTKHISTLCQQCVLEDEKHIVFECPSLRDRYENLFQAPPGDAVILFMWQDDIIGVARFIDVCLERVYTQLALPREARHLISPELAGNDVMVLLLLRSTRDLRIKDHMDTNRVEAFPLFPSSREEITKIPTSSFSQMSSSAVWEAYPSQAWRAFAGQVDIIPMLAQPSNINLGDHSMTAL